MKTIPTNSNVTKQSKPFRTIYPEQSNTIQLKKSK